MSQNIKYLNIDEQIEHLESKGLIIPSKKMAKKYLTDIGYYKLINGYRGPFMGIIRDNSGIQKKKYCENTSIDDLYHLYEFDQGIKELIFSFISKIEVMVKARMSDIISSTFGIKESEYLIQSNFKSDSAKEKSEFLEIHTEILGAINKQKDKHSAISWYSKNYGYYPFWVVSNILTLGTISLLYSKMKQPDQYAISKTFNLRAKTFESVLMIMQLFRNACAHNEIIFNYKTRCSLSHDYIENIYKAYKINKNPKTGRYMHGENDVFAIIIIFKLLLTEGIYNEFIARFKSLLLKLKKKIDDTKYQDILLTMGIVDDLSVIKDLKV